MRLRKITSLKNFSGKKVLLRTGFDVPIDAEGNIEDNSRIKESLETIHYLQKGKAKIIILTKIGRPLGKRVSYLSTQSVADELGRLLRKNIIFIPDCRGEKTKKIIENLKNGEIVLLENLRFYKEEEENDPDFIKELSSFGDAYVNEAFSMSHRNESSMTGIPFYLPSYAGFHLLREVEAIEKFWAEKQRPLVAVIGGVKISDKLGTIMNILHRVDHVLLGGALANTVLAAQGIGIGKSFVEKDMIEKLKNFPLTNAKLHIPVDVILSDSLDYPKNLRAVAIGNISKKSFIVDIGHDTERLYESIIANAKSVFFAGTMGKFEIFEFSHGTRGVFRAASFVKGYTFSGGGDTLYAIHATHSEKYFDYISSAGGATLKMMEGKTLPAFEPLLW